MAGIFFFPGKKTTVSSGPLSLTLVSNPDKAKQKNLLARGRAARHAKQETKAKYKKQEIS